MLKNTDDQSEVSGDDLLREALKNPGIKEVLEIYGALSPIYEQVSEITSQNLFRQQFGSVSNNTSGN